MRGNILRKFITIVLSFSIVFSSCALEVNAFQEGVTKVVPHGWGIEVYFSKDTVTHIGAGVGVCGVFVPEPVVTKALAVAGVAIGYCPGGIVLEYHYAGVAAKLLCPHPLVKVTLSHPTKFRWQ